MVLIWLNDRPSSYTGFLTAAPTITAVIFAARSSMIQFFPCSSFAVLNKALPLNALIEIEHALALFRSVIRYSS